MELKLALAANFATLYLVFDWTLGSKNAIPRSFQSAWAKYSTAAVASDSVICSDIGRDILERYGGNAVDASIATEFCTGVVQSHSTGIGGGGFWVIYDKKQGWFTVTSREAAPSAATEDMFSGPENFNKSHTGGKAVAIPGALKGMWEVHQRFGRLPWKTLVRPAIALCRNGVPFLGPAFRAAKFYAWLMVQLEEFRNVYFDGFKLKSQGTLIYMPKLATTLETIAEDPTSFYNGNLANDIAEELREAGGIAVLDDLRNYTVRWSRPASIELSGNLQLYTVEPPASGLIVAYILNILDGYNMSADSLSDKEKTILTYHRIVEALKFGNAKRMDLGDIDFVEDREIYQKMLSREFGERTRLKIHDHKTHDVDYYDVKVYNKPDHGTIQLSVLDQEGNAVSYSSSINLYYGSKVKGRKTGIIYNSCMEDFATPDAPNHFQFPPAEANFIRPFKKAMSSMAPFIVWDKTAQTVRLVSGAAGGSKITSAVAMVFLDALRFKRWLPGAIDLPRMHHQLIPNFISGLKTSYTVAQDLIDGLAKKGHKFGRFTGFTVIQAVLAQEDGLLAVCDFRKEGAPSGF